MKPADLLPQIYEELRKLAAAKLLSEPSGQTLDATGLVHEAYMKLGGDRTFASRSDYLQAAAQAMRRILVDRARARNALKRGSGQRVDLQSGHLVLDPIEDNLIELDEALDRLAVEQPSMAKLVQLRFFGGLTLSECAETLNISPRTADTWWAYARAWLAVALDKPSSCDR